MNLLYTEFRFVKNLDFQSITTNHNYLYLYTKFLLSTSLGLDSIAVVPQVWGS
jgi:hypothetical protein